MKGTEMQDRIQKLEAVAAAARKLFDARGPMGISASRKYLRIALEKLDSEDALPDSLIIPETTEGSDESFDSRR